MDVVLNIHHPPVPPFMQAAGREFEEGVQEEGCKRNKLFNKTTRFIHQLGTTKRVLFNILELN